MIFLFVGIAALIFTVWAFILAGGRGKMIIIGLAVVVFVLPHFLPALDSRYLVFSGRVILGVGCMIFVKWRDRL